MIPAVGGASSVTGPVVREAVGRSQQSLMRVRPLKVVAVFVDHWLFGIFAEVINQILHRALLHITIHSLHDMEGVNLQGNVTGVFLPGNSNGTARIVTRAVVRPSTNRTVKARWSGIEASLAQTNLDKYALVVVPIRKGLIVNITNNKMEV